MSKLDILIIACGRTLLLDLSGDDYLGVTLALWLGKEWAPQLQYNYADACTSANVVSLTSSIVRPEASIVVYAIAIAHSPDQSKS